MKNESDLIKWYWKREQMSVKHITGRISHCNSRSTCPPFIERKERDMANIACRIFQEQLDLVKELPEQERATVLYTAVCNAFNQFDFQTDIQIDNQNENAYVSVSDSVSVLGNTVIKLLSKSIVCKEFSNNYGGKRLNSGRPRKKNQNEYQIENQIDIQIEKPKASANVNTRFNAGFQNWKFEPALLTVAKKYWTADTIRKIEIDFSCQEYNTYTSIQELLERYPADKDKAVLPKNLGQYEYMRPQMQKWIDYKKSRGEKYKTEQSLMVCAKKLHELSGGISENADLIIEQSIANNYAGLFPLKNTKQKKPNINLDACEDNFLDDTPYWLKNKKD